MEIRLFRGLSECPANRNIIFRLYRFSFSLTYKILTCERTLISALHTLRKHHKICNTTSIKLWFIRNPPQYHSSSISAASPSLPGSAVQDWKDALSDEFKKDYYKKLYTFVKDEYSRCVVYPPADDIFNAFHFTPLKDVKVLILGQDPYHEVNQAHGLSFSVLPDNLHRLLK